MPGAPVHRMSFSASSAAPMAAATVSALMLSSVPLSSADSGLTTGISALSSSFLSTVVSTESMSPTKPKSTISPAADLTGGRLWARTSPASTPLTPTASTSRSRQMPSTWVLIRPLSTMAVTSMNFWSVMRRPSTMRLGLPSAADTSVSCGPPPCTSTTRTPK